MASLLPQQSAACFVVGHNGRDEPVKSGGVVVVANVREFVHNYIIDGLLRILHEPLGKADGILAAAAPKARPRPGDGDMRRTHAHERSVMLHLRRQDPFCLFD